MRKISVGPLFTAFLLFAAFSVFAQTEKATLRGVVTDQSGAIVPGAEIVVIELDTNIEARRVVSDSHGNYEIPDLKPKLYRIKADKAGFRGVITDNVLLDAGQVRRVDIALSVGAVNESVTVVAGAAVIQTDTGAIVGEINSKKFADVPLVDVYPSPLALLTTTPGIQGNGWNLVMSGISDRNKQTWAMDGVANDTAGDQNDNPNFFETVQVTPVNGGADAARAVNFNMVSKHGGSGFHGGVYYKHENSALNARAFYDPKKVPYILHEGEAEIGGPIIKNRTFFFAAWMHQIIPLGSFSLVTMPSSLMRTGDFSQFSTAIKDPMTGQPFPNKMIPSARWSSVSQKMMNSYMPAPNYGAAGALTTNYGWIFPYNSDLYKGDWPMFRIDHKFTSKNNFYVRWMQRKTPYIRPGATPDLTWTQARDHRQLAASDTHVLSSNMTNDFTFGHQTDHLLIGEQEKGFTPLFGDDVVKALGLQGVNAKNYHIQGFPATTISGLTTLNSNNGGVDNTDQNNGINTFTDTLTWNKGRHVMRFGAEVRAFWFLSGNISNQVFGNFNFNGSITGVGFGDFLLGIPFTATRLDPLVLRRNTSKQMGYFFSDSFKVTQKLTVDWGLRWDYYSLPTYDDGLMYNWDEKTGNVIVQQEALSKVNPLYPKTINIVAGQVVPSPSKHNFRPRISAAYRLGNKMVVRGGYGEFTETFGSYTQRLPGPAPFQLSESYNNVITGGVPLFQFPNPFPGSLASASVPSQSVTAIPRQTDNGVIRQYNVTIEREINRGIGLRVSYIGSRGNGFNYTFNENKPQASTIPFTTARRPFPQFVNTTVYRNDGLWHYDSLQAEVSKRAGQFIFNSNYTFANNMNNYSVTEDPYNITNRWARDGSDRRHYWVTSTTWLIPVGKGRRFLSSSPWIVDELLGGWAMQTISTFASGGYFSPSFSGSDPSNTNTVGGLPDRVADNSTFDSHATPQWFNQAGYLQAFKAPQAGHYGNSGANILQGQGINVHHLSLAKTFPITERFKTTFTGQISNIMNHPHFNNPNTNISNPNPGLMTSVIPNYNPEKQGFRQIDLKLRIEW